jgi:hypothetical protein
VIQAVCPVAVLVLACLLLSKPNSDSCTEIHVQGSDMGSSSGRRRSFLRRLSFLRSVPKLTLIELIEDWKTKEKEGLLLWISLVVIGRISLILASSMIPLHSHSASVASQCPI